MADQGSAHGSRTFRRERRMDQFLGVSHVRAERRREVIAARGMRGHRPRLQSSDCSHIVGAVYDRASILLFSLLALILFPGILHAHEIGTTHVSVQFESSKSYHIEIATDAASLVEKLSSVAGEPVTGPSGPAALQVLLRKYDDVFRRRFCAAFDGIAVRPTIEYVVA